MKSGMYIDSHLERCVLVQTAELCTSGKYLNWNLKICPICIVWEIDIIAIENCSKRRTGEIWYVH